MHVTDDSHSGTGILVKRCPSIQVAGIVDSTFHA